MTYTWTEGNNFAQIATLYSNNITLNNSAAEHFKDIRWCLVGIDDVNNKMAIKPVTKREIDLNLVPVKNLHKVSIGKGYARISNKSIIEKVSVLLNQEITGNKFSATFNDKENLLEVDLKDPL